MQSLKYSHLPVRLLIALAIGLVSGILCTSYQVRFDRGGGDVGWAIRLIVDLANGIDPYSYPTSLTPMSYPLTAGLALAPLALVPSTIAAGIFFGVSSALLALGLTRDGQWWRLVLFLALPYWAALITVQWSPLLFAVALFPFLLPLTLCKPHIGFPIAMTRLTWRRAIACAVFGIGSLLFLPDWPLRWLGHQADPGQYLPPIITLPFGPFILLALLRWRDSRARFVLLFACVPQRLWYDCLLLLLIVQTPRQLLGFVALTWLAYLIWFFYPAVGPMIVTLLIYLPAVALIMRTPLVVSPSPLIDNVAAPQLP